MQNPFSIMFGKEPPRMISRLSQSDLVIRTFTQESPANQIFMITGVRGAGKTVFMTNIAKQFRNENHWVTVDLNPAVDLLRDLTSKLYNDKSITELFKRAKIHLSALDMGSIADSYREVFHLNVEQSRYMARITKGYPYAFQVLGYYTFENNGDYKAAVPACKQYLNEYVYDKIWSELSRNDRKILYHLTQCKDGSIAELREKMDMKPNELSPYRNRLIKKGLINGEERGYMHFVLPFFEDYVVDNSWEWG